MNANVLRLVILFGMLLLAPRIWAQQEVFGKIVDESGPLPGGSIVIMDTGKGTTSALDGSFIITGIKQSGKLKISFIGYKEKVIEFLLVDGKNVDVGRIVLSANEANKLNDVVISSAYKPSQARALNIKKTSISIAEVLASDAIGKLPDRNAAEAVQRLQGVTIERDMGEGRFVSVRGTPIQWSSSTLNGNRMPSASGDNANRGVQMDIFPSELIEYVKLSKAITPDMDGDAIGGSIDFITKSAPSKRTLSVNAVGSYADQSHKPGYSGSVVYGDKITDKLKFITSAVIWSRTTGIDAMRADYDFGNKTYGINQLQLRDYLANRQTLGFNGGLDYKINTDHKIYFKGLYSRYLDAQTVRESYFNFAAKNVLLQSRHADYVTQLYSFQLGGESKLSDKLNAVWSLNNAKSTFDFNSPKNLPEDERGYPIVNFIQPMTYGGLSSDGKKYLDFDSPNGVGDQNDVVLPHVSAALDANKMKLNQVLLSQNRNSERNYNAQLDLNHQTTEKFSIKAGGKFSNKRKESFGQVLVWLPGANIGIPGALPVYLNGLQTADFPRNGGFLSEIGMPYNDVLINQVTNNQIDEMYTDDFRSKNKMILVQGPNANSNFVSSFSGKENVYAGYVMGDYKISNKIRLTIGVRNEYNQIKFSGKKIVAASATTQTVKDTVQTNNYNALLPSLHFKYSPTENTNFRFALTRGFARPDFNQLNPSSIISDVNLTITDGNTNLKPTFSNNIDFMFEHYLSNVGIITAGAFYKQIKNYIYSDQSIENINGRQYVRSTPNNLDNSWLAGFEMGLSKRFTELPGFLGKLGFEGNYTFVYSKLKLPFYTNGVLTNTVSTTLPKQGKNNFNLILFYETDKFMARAAGNYKGKYLNEIRSSAGPDFYQYFDKNFTLDFSSSYAISKKVRFFVELNNILNEPNRFYQTDISRIENLSYSSITGQAGVSISVY